MLSELEPCFDIKDSLFKMDDEDLVEAYSELIFLRSVPINVLTET